MTSEIQAFKILILFIFGMSNSSALCAQTFVPVVFYNVENLFDAKDDPEKLDEDYLPKGRLAYNEIHFQKKIANLTRVIKELSEHLETPPGLIGLAEVENAFVLDKLVGHSALKPFDYAFPNRYLVLVT